MPRPATTPLGESIYARLGPVAVQDEALGWPMLTFVQALAEMGRQVEELVREPDADVLVAQGIDPAEYDRPAWTPLLDVDLSPDWNLPYLGQFVGVRVTPGATPAQARQQIRAEGGFQRGTPDAMRAAVKTTLGGNQYVFLKERDGDEDHITVVTRTSETPSSSVTLAAAMSQKAAGLILTLTTTTVRTWLEVDAAGGTWSGVAATYGTWASARGF